MLTAKEKISKLLLNADATVNVAMVKKKQTFGSYQRLAVAIAAAATIRKQKLKHHHNSSSIEREQKKKVEIWLERI